MIIAGAGGAAHLPGMAASMTALPVLGVPVESHALKGMDSLLSIVQMPAGIPVGTLGHRPRRGGQCRAARRRHPGHADPALAARLDGLARRADRCRAGRAGMTGFPLPPGSIIGILGGGQLGRMSALAAARLGYACHVFAPDADPPGMQVAAHRTVADYEDRAALARFAASVAVVTFEFENVPRRRARGPVRPGAVPAGPGRAGHLPGPRGGEGASSTGIGVPVAPWRLVETRVGPRRGGGRARPAGGAEDDAAGL